MIVDRNFQTPPEVAAMMATYIPKAAKSIFEPTPGVGNIVSAIKEAGFDCISPTDYFLSDKTLRYDCIVMNPPFSKKYAWMKEASPEYHKCKGMELGYKIFNDCLTMSDNVIALMPWFTISDSDVRLRKLLKYGIKKVVLLPRKTFAYARIQTAVFVMQKGHEGPTDFGYFEFKNKQHTLLPDEEKSHSELLRPTV